MQLPYHTAIKLCHWQRGASSLFQLPEDKESLSSLLYNVGLPCKQEDDHFGLADSGVLCILQAHVCGTDMSEEDC